MNNQNKETTKVPSLRCRIGVVIIGALGFVGLMILFGTVIKTSKVDDIEKSITQGIKQDFADLSLAVREMSTLGDLGMLAVKKDTLGLVGALINQSSVRDVGSVLVTDKYGFTLARSRSVAIRGDNVFQASAIGKVFTEHYFASGFNRGRYSPLSIGVGFPLWNARQIQGSIFAFKTITDDYAKEFRDAYLKSDIEIAWYRDDRGIVASSFSDQKAKEIIGRYFDRATLASKDVMLLQFIDHPIRINGKSYMLAEHEIESLEEGTQGLFYFIPVYTVGYIVVSGLIVLFVVFSTALILRKKNLPIAYFLKRTLIVSLISGGIGSVLFYQVVMINSIAIDQHEFHTKTATILMAPEYDIVAQGERHSSIMFFDSTNRVRTIQGALNYTVADTEISSFSLNDSLCKSGTNSYVSQEVGTVTFSCEFIGSSNEYNYGGEIVDITFTPKSSRVAFKFDQQVTRVVDQSGEDMMIEAIDGGYVVASPFSSTDVPFALFSDSHPNFTTSYSSPVVRVSWPYIEGLKVRAAFNRIENYEPQKEGFIAGTTTTFIAPEDGTYYAHITATLPGLLEPRVYHFPVHIDSNLK